MLTQTSPAGDSGSSPGYFFLNHTVYTLPLHSVCFLRHATKCKQLFNLINHQGLPNVHLQGTGLNKNSNHHTINAYALQHKPPSNQPPIHSNPQVYNSAAQSAYPLHSLPRSIARLAVATLNDRLPPHTPTS